MVRFIWSEVNTVIALGCRPKQLHRPLKGGDPCPVPKECVGMWTNCKSNQGSTSLSKTAYSKCSILAPFFAQLSEGSSLLCKVWSSIVFSSYTGSKWHLVFCWHSIHITFTLLLILELVLIHFESLGFFSVWKETKQRGKRSKYTNFKQLGPQLLNTPKKTPKQTVFIT